MKRQTATEYQQGAKDHAGLVGNVKVAAIKMTEKERLIRDITTIRESINRDWADLSSILSLSHDDRTAIRAHIEQCVQDLNELTERLDRLAPDSN